jgi:hypothetical protein
MSQIDRKVRGSLFLDYVRMIRGQKSIAWENHLEPEDLAAIAMKIDPDGFYPMATFERLGNAILREVGHGDVESVRMWGRISVDALRAKYPSLVAQGDPVDTLRRFSVMRGTFFDFEAVSVHSLHEEHAIIGIHYYMGPFAEEAASHQTMGFFERLLELGGAEGVSARFLSRSWTGDESTKLELHWKTP